MISIERLTHVDAQSVADLNQLMGELRSDQLGDAVEVPSDLDTILNEKNIIVIVVKDDTKIIGVASLYLIPKIGKTIAHVEDVVVSSAYRGQGLGEKLIREIIDVAKKHGVKTIGLTSRPSREAANKLYQKVGFMLKETNVYRLSL